MERTRWSREGESKRDGEGWLDDSAGKVLAMRAGGAEFGSHFSCRSLYGAVVRSVVPMLGREMAR